MSRHNQPNTAMNRQNYDDIANYSDHNQEFVSGLTNFTTPSITHYQSTSRRASISASQRNLQPPHIYVDNVQIRNVDDDQTSHLNPNTPSRQRSEISKSNSSKSSASIDRRRLQIQLHYAKKRQQQLKEVLELEEAVALAQLNEGSAVSETSITEDELAIPVNPAEKRNDINNWVAEVRNMNAEQINPPQSILQRNEQQQHAEVNNYCQSFDNTRQQQSQPPHHHNVENWIARQSVPKDLPTFSGDPLEWPQFINQYRSTTHICSLSSYENQIRLQKCLKGKAKEIVQSLLLYPENVERAINILGNRFGRPEHIIHFLLEQVRNFPLIKDDKIDSLVNFFDVLTNLVFTLQNLKENDHIRNPILYQEILAKLPTNKRLDFVQFYNELNSQNPPIVELYIWLERKVTAASQLMIPTISVDKNTTKHSKPKAMTFAINENKSKIELACIFCDKKDHKIISCPDFKSLTEDERWKFVSKRYICYGCLKLNHSIKTCRVRKTCSEPNCKMTHHPLLHQSSKSVNDKNKNNDDLATNCHINDFDKVLLKIIPVTLKGPNQIINTFALLDEASTVTLIESDVANQLGLEGPTKTLKIQWTNNKFNEHTDSKTVSVSIKGVHTSGSYYLLRRVKTITNLALPTQNVDMKSICKKYSYMNKFKDLGYANGHPTILIGQDNWPVAVTRKVSYGSWMGPTVSKTWLGWVVHGNVSRNETNENQYAQVHVHEVKSDISPCADKDDLNVLQELLKQQWSYDLCSSKSISKDVSVSLEDKRCLKIMDETIKRVDNRYETGLLWKKDNLELPESYSNALKRLNSLENKMDKNPTYSKIYVDKMEDYISKGYLKKLTKSETNEKNSKLWYLPHFGVVNPNKPNKLRIVFDAASKSHGYSLNDFLLSGPDLYNVLPNILMNFRINKIVFIGDIKEMFLQILVRKEDRFAQRIIWRGTDRQREPDVYELQVVSFGATCSPCVAQEVKSRNAKDHLTEFPKACSEIINNHYMDDYLGGEDSVEHAIKLIHEVISVHSKCGFNICNWISNSREVLASIPENLRASNVVQINFDESHSEERILGIWWNYVEDNFCYQLKFHKIDPKILNYEKPPTKRDILKIVMSIFDPLGFISNVIIIGKMLMQNIWESGIAWDHVITDAQFEIWRNWSLNFKQLSTFKIPRLMSSFPLTETTIQLHVFCDASENAYACVAYLRFEYGGSIKCTLVNSKARVAPLKPTSIPRLELQAAVLGARLCHSLRNSLNVKIDAYFLWSDSKTVLYWVKSSSKRFKTYVAQRLGEIHELSEPNDWRYVPSLDNVSDDATKFKPFDFTEKSRWLNGPQFLHCNIPAWPKGNFDVQDISENVELKPEFVATIIEVFDLEVPDITRISNWNKYVRVMAWILKFTRNMLQIIRKNDDHSNSYLKLLYPDDISKAEVLLFKKIQSDSYKDELQCLRNDMQFDKNSSLITFTCRLSEDGLLRIHGRLENAIISEDAKNPIILNHKHELTYALVKYYHDQNNHIGTETIIAQLRQRFWITNVRSLVKKCAYNCQACKNRKATPQIPFMGQLPRCRVERTIRPFVKCGVDYFGPIEVTVNRKHEKRYGVIFTCMAIRAVHIEIAHDLSSSSFIHVFRQFGSRRGFPEELYSDNGSNFRKANKEIKSAIDDWSKVDVAQFCTSKRCKWFFNPPAAPHMGGAWERLVQSIKKHLYLVLQDRYPKEYVLRTLFCEIENLINSRPLTFNSIDPDDEPPITPNHLLIGMSSVNESFVQTSDRDLIMINMWRASQRLADIFWKRWVAEYLPTILKVPKWSKESKNVELGDIVIIVDSESPRNCWPKGKIEQIYPAKDGKVRVVDVKTSTGGIFRRPVSKIIKLDVLKYRNSLDN